MSTDLYDVQYRRVEERDELRVEGVKREESNIIELSHHGQLPVLTAQESSPSRLPT
jgi:hypothetical protein